MQRSPRQWPGYIGAIIVFVLLSGVGTAYGVISAIPTFGPTDGEGGGGGGNIRPPGGLDPVPPGKPQTLLLIGSDKRSKKSADGSSRSGQLSDTIMLVHLDPDRPTTVMSIPRDTQVRVKQKDGTYDTEKINAAFAQGGAELTYQVVTDLLHIPISHIVVTNFNAFQEAVNRLGCLFEDIDRSYFNDNSQGQNYSAINVKSGYQLLCGADTLEWVRFRHTDNDLVRGARQQAFLRSAKNQVAASRLLDGTGTAIFKIFRHYTETDPLSRGAVLSLLKLIVNTAHQPIRSVPFIATDSKVNSNLLVTPAALAEMRQEFLKATVTKALPSRPKGAKVKKKKKVQHTGLAKNLVKVPSETTSPQLIKASFDLASADLPVYYPSVRYAFGGYASLDPVRTYRIKPSHYSKRSYPAFRLTYSAGAGLLGQYYGLQGTTWKDAPILKEAHTTVRHNGRTLQVYSSAGRYQLVAWETPKAVYWISNSVSLSLGNAQMLDIASSLTKVAG